MKLCPIHETLTKKGEITPVEDCPACLRQKRNELERELRKKIVVITVVRDYCAHRAANSGTCRAIVNLIDKSDGRAA